jgi:hypothetical protein
VHDRNFTKTYIAPAAVRQVCEALPDNAPNAFLHLAIQEFEARRELPADLERYPTSFLVAIINAQHNMSPSTSSEGTGQALISVRQVCVTYHDHAGDSPEVVACRAKLNSIADRLNI